MRASYEIGCLYTILLPRNFRTRFGVYYTPPALTDRLLDLAEEAGVDWRYATVLDPACGGGAFLAPIALRMRSARADLAAPDLLAHLATHLRGYKVSTGPLVWNRHKDGFRSCLKKGRYPVIWAESVLPSGAFAFRFSKANHEPFFEPNAKEMWLVRDQACILVQRTTSLEQQRRLIAAPLPGEFIHQYHGVIVENHLNMIIPKSDRDHVPMPVLATLLNSAMVDTVFR